MSVQKWGPGYHFEFPPHALHSHADGVGVTLTRAEAVAHLHALHAALLVGPEEEVVDALLGDYDEIGGGS